MAYCSIGVGVAGATAPDGGCGTEPPASEANELKFVPAFGIGAVALP